MRNVFLFLVVVSIGSSSYAQKISIGQVYGSEFAIGKNGGSNRVYNFNKQMVFFQPVVMTVQLNDKLGVQAEAQVGAYLRDSKIDKVNVPSPSVNDPYSFKPAHYILDSDEIGKLRLGLIYNIERQKWAFKPRLLAGVMKLEEVNQVTLTLKEKNTNIYFSDGYRPKGRDHTSLNLFLISGGINVSRALTPRFSLTADVLYSHAGNTFPVSGALTNLYTNEESKQTFDEKVRLNSIALGIGFSIRIVKNKEKENLLHE